MLSTEFSYGLNSMPMVSLPQVFLLIHFVVPRKHRLCPVFSRVQVTHIKGERWNQYKTTIYILFAIYSGLWTRLGFGTMAGTLPDYK